MQQSGQPNQLEICRLLAKAGETETSAVAADRRRDLRTQVLSRYSDYRDIGYETFMELLEFARTVSERSQEEIRRRAAFLGIPPLLGTSVELEWPWCDNRPVESLREDLIQVGDQIIDRLGNEAFRQMDQACQATATRLVSSVPSEWINMFLDEIQASPDRCRALRSNRLRGSSMRISFDAP